MTPPMLVTPYRSAGKYICIPLKRKSGGVFYEKVMQYL